jgi:polyribonucleotide nucleotidyltransferase
LDPIVKRVSVKHSVEFAHDEIEDIKKANERKVEIEKKTQERLVELEATNTKLLNSVIDIKARSMRDNLIFYNIDGKEGENTTSFIHNIIEEHLGIENASSNVIDRDDLVPEGVEAVCLEIIKRKSKPVLIASAYRPPNSQIEFLDKIEVLFQNLDNEHK